MKEVTVVIPVRENGNAKVTLASLAKQTYQDFDIVISWDHGHGANWVRNRGAERVQTSLVLFSDDDITWHPSALQTLVHAAHDETNASFFFGAYELDGKIYCDNEYSEELLRKRSCVSTMSLVRMNSMAEWDENLDRLQDWDFFLTLSEYGYWGKYVGKVLFSTKSKPGITVNGKVSWNEAAAIVKKKHSL